MVEPKFYSAFENISAKKYRKEKYRYQLELLKMQEWALKHGKRIAIVFEGRDAAGKGSAIKRMAENLMTKHHRVIEIGSPTPKQNRSWFHTFEKTLPKKGEIVFYDRSWYSRAMIQPTMSYCSDAQYKYFMKHVKSSTYLESHAETVEPNKPIFKFIDDRTGLNLIEQSAK